MAKNSRHPRPRTLIAAVALAGGLVLGTASPALADYNSPMYPTMSACKAARPTYVSSWTSPQQCWPMYNYNGTKLLGYQFLVKTRY
ncbi:MULTISPECIES: hypothetical protein [unclassified Micromonospora]|uniref:hypothetical protein n=1 Tax=unclassified Micromonospora TaxID=2617518 RepID=UPI002E1DD5D3|nr:hypothetical protein OG990_35185 [Micromonospora sp. NBC_00858]